MLILTGLPASWDGIQLTILANHSVENLRPEIIIPVLQEEWNRRHARRDKTAHFAKSNLRGGPQCQQWQRQQQQNSYNNNYQTAGPSSYNRPAPYQKKFSQKPNYQQSFQNQ